MVYNSSWNDAEALPKKALVMMLKLQRALKILLASDSRSEIYSENHNPGTPLKTNGQVAPAAWFTMYNSKQPSASDHFGPSLVSGPYGPFGPFCENGRFDMRR
jgi:hypothetical protein